MAFKNIFGPDGKMGRIQFILTVLFVLTPLSFFFATLSSWVHLLNAGGIFLYGVLVYCLFVVYMLYMSIIRRLRDARLPIWLMVFAISPIGILFILVLTFVPPRVAKSTDY